MIRRFTRFCQVGLTGVGGDTAVLFLLADPRTLHWNVSFSKFIAAAIAMANNFVWNGLWTFGDLASGHKWRAVLARFTTFNLICTVGNLVAIILVTTWNFAINLRISWTRPSEIRSPKLDL
ncbi:MAG: GtrA family protein [Solirubrobacterales bacterium]|nr:GtrA family protein [Solirubrobacterales bacterium]